MTVHGGHTRGNETDILGPPSLRNPRRKTVISVLPVRPEIDDARAGMTKRRRLKSTRQFRPFRDELPSRLALTDDQRGWLLRLLHNPIRRDANKDPLPYGMATVLLDYQLIEPGTESSRGAIAAMTWRVWRLTESGRRTARQISDNPHREIVRIT